MDHALTPLRGTIRTLNVRDAPVEHLYVHIPFCPVKCDYCAFVTRVGSAGLIEPYVAAVQIEARSYAGKRQHAPLRTVYLGGGTPSMLTVAQVSRLLSTFVACFGLRPDAEVTIEAHPATVKEDKLAGYLEAGVNRISFGVESMVPAELRALGRLDIERAPIAALTEARRAGFNNIAADLMYGIPLQTTATWERTLRAVLDAEPDHLSLYPLMIEPHTVFGKRWEQRQLVVPDDEHVVEMYELACRTLTRAGYDHYEVGSWCRGVHESRHNLAYWHNRQYIGLGVGAHGYVQGRRTVNVRQTTKYISTVEAGEDPIDRVEPVDTDTSRVDHIMLGLRLLREGLELERLKSEHDWDLIAQRGSEVAMLAEAGLIRVERERLFLAESAVPIANEVWERLAF